MDKILKKVELTRLNGGAETVTENVIKETALTINVNGKHDTSVIFLGKQEKEFVVGHLFAQSIIHQASDIKSLTIKNHTAEVTLVKTISRPNTPGKINSPLKVTKEDVFSCVRAVLKSPVFAETEAVHSAGIFLHGKQPIAIAEDIGRHHALDKVIGAALLQGVSLNDVLIASTGRMASEMVAKICRAGIPIFASKAAVTDGGIALAKKNGITLIGFVREAGSKMNTDMSVRVFDKAVMKIYCGATRIIC